MFTFESSELGRRPIGRSPSPYSAATVPSVPFVGPDLRRHHFGTEISKAFLHFQISQRFFATRSS